jgi:hypothetical protein
MSDLFARAWLLPALIIFISTNALATTQGSSNPDISVNALFLYKNSSRNYDPNSVDRNGFSVQEAEMQFASDVDPYWRFVGTFSMSQEADAAQLAQTPPHYAPRWKFEPEEAYAETLDLSNFTVRVGKFKAAMGKHNQLHTHAYPFIDAPLQNSVLLGDEGINDAGASAAALLPLPWFSEFSVQAFAGQREDDPYFASQPGNFVALAHFKNLWDLTDELTSELGVSGASGQNSSSSSTNIYGADLTFKWRPSLERAAIWASEVLHRDFNTTTSERGDGFATWFQFQPARRWWMEVRAEYLQLRDQATVSVSPFQRKQSALIAFDPSEFSELRVQYDHRNDNQAKDENRAMLQFNYTIGAHPAHGY